MKKSITALLVLLVLGGGGFYVWNELVRLDQPSELEQWLGRQVVGIVQAFVVPTVSFERIDYQAPYTLVLEGFQLTHDDVTLARVKRAELTLGEIPERGKPLQIERIALDTPELDFVRNPDGGFVGWSNFVKSDVAADPYTTMEEQKISDVLELREVRIDNGQLVYAEGDGSEPMVLPGLTLRLDTVPDPEAPGIYSVDTRIGREGLFEMHFAGRVDLDRALLQARKFTVQADLGPEQYRTLPPQLQAAMRAHEVTGHLEAELAGRVSLYQPVTSQGTLRATLREARLKSDGKVWSAERCALEISALPSAAPAVATGTLQVHNARLMYLPVVSDLVDKLAKLSLNTDVPATDRASADFALHLDRAYFKTLEATSSVVAMRGNGNIYYDGRLDLKINAGVLEKLQNETGVFGDLFGALSDRLVKYGVTGTMQQPKLKVLPLGLGG